MEPIEDFNTLEEDMTDMKRQYAAMIGACDAEAAEDFWKNEVEPLEAKINNFHNAQNNTYIEV